jgi:hypothetical protein
MIFYLRGSFRERFALWQIRALKIKLIGDEFDPCGRAPPHIAWARKSGLWLSFAGEHRHTLLSKTCRG